MYRNLPKSITLYLLVTFFVSIDTELIYAGSSRAPTDTLRPGVSQFTQNDSMAQSSFDSTCSKEVSRSTRQNVTQSPKNWFYTLFGVIGTGIATLLTFALGFAFTSARNTIIGEVAYPMGIFVILLGGVMTIIFVHRLKRYKAFKNNSTGRPTSR